MYIDRSIKDYLADLAAKIPAPGGGSAAALAGAMALALMSMVGNYTIGSKKYKEHEERIATILVRLEKMRGEFEILVDRDVDGYNELSKALKDNKSDPGLLEKAYRAAAEPPLEICNKIGECIDICGELVSIGNKNLITDTAVAAVMLEAAFQSSKFNALINLKYMKDDRFITSTKELLLARGKDILRIKDDVVKKAESEMEVS